MAANHSTADQHLVPSLTTLYRSYTTETLRDGRAIEKLRRVEPRRKRSSFTYDRGAILQRAADIIEYLETKLVAIGGMTA